MHLLQFGRRKKCGTISDAAAWAGQVSRVESFGAAGKNYPGAGHENVLLTVGFIIIKIMVTKKVTK